MINYFYLPCYSNFLSLITKLFLLRYFSKLFFFFRWRWQLPLNSLSQLPLYIVVIISSFSPPAMLGRKERKREREKIAEAEDNNKKLSALKKFDFADQWKKKSFNLIKKKKKTTARPNQPNSTQPNSTKPTKPNQLLYHNYATFVCFIVILYWGCTSQFS